MKNEFDYLNDVKMDFSCYENEVISEGEINNMGKNMNNLRSVNFKKIIATAACVTIFTVTTAFAAGFIIKTVKTGYNSFHQIDSTAEQPLMEELKGKIFDENGNELYSISASDFDNIYDKEGNKITGEMYAKMIEEATGGLVEISGKHDLKDREVDFENLKLAKENAEFDIKAPEYLPNDYTLDRVYTYKTEEGLPSSEYITLVYKNTDSKEIDITSIACGLESFIGKKLFGEERDELRLFISNSFGLKSKHPQTTTCNKYLVEYNLRFRIKDGNTQGKRYLEVKHIRKDG